MCVLLCTCGEMQCVRRERSVCVWVLRDRGVNVHGEIGLCVSGVRVSVWMESHGCDSGGRLGGVCVRQRWVCVCVCVEKLQ